MQSEFLLQLGKLLCRTQPVAAAIYLVFAQGKAASPEKLKHEAAVSRLCRNQPVRRVIFLDGVEDDATIQHERAVKF